MSSCHQGNKSKSAQKVFAAGQTSVGCPGISPKHDTPPRHPRVHLQLGKQNAKRALFLEAGWISTGDKKMYSICIIYFLNCCYFYMIFACNGDI